MLIVELEGNLQGEMGELCVRPLMLGIMSRLKAGAVRIMLLQELVLKLGVSGYIICGNECVNESGSMQSRR